MSAAALYLLLGGLVALGFGLAYLFRSHGMARVVGIELSSARARADYRAIYGGSQTALGVFFVAAAFREQWHPAALSALALFAVGFGIVRLGSLALDREWRDVQWVVGVLEISAGAVAALLV